jgi:hypothetical protein
MINHTFTLGALIPWSLEEINGKLVDPLAWCGVMIRHLIFRVRNPCLCGLSCIVVSSDQMKAFGEVFLGVS